MRAADPAGIGELENPLGSWVARPVHRMPEPRHPFAGGVSVARDLLRDRGRLNSGPDLCLRRFEQPRARLGRPQDDRATAEDPRRDGAEAAWGRPLTMNVAMPIAAVMLDLGFPPSSVKAVPILARTAGLLAHLVEEQERPLGFLMAAKAEEAIEYER